MRSSGESKCQMCFQSTKQTLQLIVSYNFSSLYFWAETRLGLGTGTKDLEGSSSKTQTKQTSIFISKIEIQSGMKPPECDWLFDSQESGCKTWSWSLQKTASEAIHPLANITSYDKVWPLGISARITVEYIAQWEFTESLYKGGHITWTKTHQ